MGNEDYLNLLKQGAEAWNDWRNENPNLNPNLRGLSLQRLNLVGANLTRVDLRYTHLVRTSFIESNLRGAKLSYADLTRAKLTRANLGEARLIGTTLRHANLSGASLSVAELPRASLAAANLSGASLMRANLSESNLIGANLRRANLSLANLARANFTGADLTDADFTGANLDRTVFADNDLRGAIGLDRVHHLGPSEIGLSTIYKSDGRIPEVFLRGCGVPDEFIIYIRSLVASGRSIEFYSCFISYSSRDQKFADRLYADLQNNGVRCWLATEDLKIGDKFRFTIDESIRVHDKLLLILSEHSTSSQWVEKEVETAMEREREENRIVLFPVKLDVSVIEIKSGWPADVRRTRYIGDFTCWHDSDAYQKAFDRLLRDLKTS
jgi:uncharacterized protein YjbI with pentapeptide repeats